MSNIPIDIETAKNTKLFKKFMESKNKSSVSITSGSVSGPRIENINVNIRSSLEETNINKFGNSNNKSEFYGKTEQMAVKKEDSLSNNVKMMDRQQQTYKKNAQVYKFTDPNMRNQTYNPNNFDPSYNYNFSSNNNSNLASVQLKRQQPSPQPQRHEPLVVSLQQQSFTSNSVPTFFTGITTTKPELSEDLPQKYVILLQQHNLLKTQLTLQRKQHKKQQIKLQEQIDLLNKKIFQLRSYEDELLLQNKRYKERGACDYKQKQKLQQNNRQLGYQIQQLKDLLNGQQSQNKKKQDESGYIKKQNQDLRQKIRQLEMQILILKDQNNVIQREKHVAGKQVNNKDLHINEMRDKINSLINENGVLRDQMYHITAKLYNYQQQNQILKADLRRHADDFPKVYLQEQLQSAKLSRPQYSYQQQTIQNSAEKSRVETNTNVPEKSERRRGEFARERGLKKAQTINNNSSSMVQQQQQNYMMQKPLSATTNQNNQQNKQIQNNNNNSNKDVGQAIRKLDQLNQQLQKLKDMKAMNGTMRRQKINLQREILELEEFVKSKQNY